MKIKKLVKCTKIWVIFGYDTFRCYMISAYSFWPDLLFKMVIFLDIALFVGWIYIYPAQRANWRFPVWPLEIVSIVDGPHYTFVQWKYIVVQWLIEAKWRINVSVD